MPAMAEERLQKILARAGIASRRKAEEYILAGRVTVNGQVVTRLGTKADPERDDIRVDGRRIKLPSRYVYLALYKPRNCLTTVRDPLGRPTVMDFVRDIKERIFPVGRLDYHSEGLLLMTNDGDFAARLISPSTKIERTYLVKVNGLLTPEQEEEFRRGVPLFGRRTGPAKLRLVRRARNPWYEVTITETRQNQIRLMFLHFGRLVEKLRRVRIGFLSLGKLKPGQYRFLTPAEVERFRKLLGLTPVAGARSA